MLKRLWNVFPLYEVLLLIYTFIGISVFITISSPNHILDKDYIILSDIVTYYKGIE